MNCKLTIITVSFNDLKGLKRTFDSIYPIIQENFLEWIIIDNLSNDGTFEFFSELSDSLSNVRFISERDFGIYDAMNKGVILANGEFLWFLNAGDISLLKSFGDFNFSDFSTINIFNIELLNDNLQTLNWKGLSTNLNDLKSYPSIPHQSSIISITVFHNLGSYDLNYKIIADYDFFCKSFVNNVSFKFFPEHKISGFINDGISSDFKNSYRIYLELSKIQKKYFGRVKLKTKIFYISKYVSSFFISSTTIQSLRRIIYR